MAKKKAGRKLVDAPRKKKQWTPEEEAYLSDSWGTKSIKTLAKNLGRSEQAVIVRAQRLGCGPFLDSGDYIALNQLIIELYGPNNTGYPTYRLIAKGLPVKEKLVRRCKRRVIYIDEFWKWAEKNKSLLDFSRMEPLCFGAEPAWVKVKRENDKRQAWQQMPHNAPWTEYDDQKLRRMLRARKYTYTDLSRELRRSEGAVKRRIADLQITDRPIRNKTKPWTDEEVDQLLSMLDQGFTYSQIAEKLNRSALATREKHERLQNPNYMKQYNRGHSKDYDYVGIRDVSPAQIKKDMAARKDNQFVEVGELPREEMMI